MASSNGVHRPGVSTRTNGGRVDRYYDPVTGQFLTVDPDVAESGQPYAFTGDDPLNATDPLGSIVNQGPGEPMAGVSAKSAVHADTIDYNDFTNGAIDDEAAYLKKANSGPISPWIAYPVLAIGLFIPGLDDGPDEAGIAAESGAEAGEGVGNAVEPLYDQAPYDGFLGGYSTDQTLEPGEVIDRYGNENGRFFSPEGTPLEARSLPPGQGPYNSYEVLKSFSVKGGIAAPAFGESGLGVQYMSSQSVSELIDAGFIKPVG
jgi:hypothetical protein